MNMQMHQKSTGGGVGGRGSVHKMGQSTQQRVWGSL